MREVVLSPDGTKVYAGGAFTKIGGASRPNFAAELDAATGSATAFNPSVGGGGRAVTVELTPDGSRFFVSTESNTVFAYDLGSNTPVWSQQTTGNTQAMAASATGELYVGGHVINDQVALPVRNYLASFRVDTGEVTSWDPNPTGGKLGIWALEIDGAHLHAGGVFQYFSSAKQQGYARFSGAP